MTAQETGTANWYSTVSTAVMGATDTSLTVDSVDGAPVPPCYLVVEPDNADQREVMLFTGLATKTFTGATVATNRYLAGSAAGSGLTHPSGSVVEYRPLAQLFTDLNDRIDAAPATADVVLKSLYDANTILKADTNDTPEAMAVAANSVLLRAGGEIEALAMGASTLLARLASGDIVAATPAQANALLGTLTTSIILGPGDFEAVDGSPTRDGLLSSIYWNAWLLDAASAEAIAAGGIIPSGWATVDVDMYWSNAGAGAGNVVWNYRMDTKGDGETMGNIVSDVSATIAAPAQYVVKKSTILSGEAVTAGEWFSAVLYRLGADAADTLANDAAVLGFVIRRAS